MEPNNPERANKLAALQPLIHPGTYLKKQALSLLFFGLFMLSISLMLKDPFIWIALLSIIGQGYYYTWLNNYKNYKARKKLILLTFRYGWVINLINTITAAWLFSIYDSTGNIEITIEATIGIGTAFCWAFWLMCKDGDLC